jgi:small subunit ribosomal protein S20
LPHSKSAKKRVRQSEDCRVRNRSVKSALRTTIMKFEAAVEGGDAAAAQAAFRAVQKKIDKSASKGVLPKGRAARVKSRLSVKLKAGKKA